MRITVATISTLIAIVGAELGLRAFHPLDDPNEALKRRVRDNPYIRSEFSPGLHFPTEVEPGLPGLSGRHDFSTNALGYRGGALAIPKPRSERRVFLVGGSTIECFYLDDTQSVDAVVERELRKATPSEQEAHVYGAGKSGDATWDHVSMLVHRIVHLQPDAVVVLSGANDLIGECRGADYLHRAREGPHRTFGLMLDLLTSEFQIVRHVRAIGPSTEARRLQEITYRSKYGEKISGFAGIPESDRAPPSDTTGFRINLRTIAGVASANGIGLVLATQPSTWNSPDPATRAWHWMNVQAGERYREDKMEAALEAFNETTREVAREQGVELCDLARTLPRTGEVMYDDMHFNAQGAERVGREFVEALGRVESRRSR
jgi:lysophospholipase L1-like esterase